MKKRTVALNLIICLSVASLVGCGTTGIERPMQAKTLLWSYPKERPVWTVQQEERIGDSYYFVGISLRHSTEKGARDNALFSANTEATNYFAKVAKVDNERNTNSSASESSVNDGVVKTRFSEKQVADNMVKRLHPQDWYIEQWKGEDGKPFYMAFVRSRIPVDEVDNALVRADDYYRSKREVHTEAPVKQQKALNAGIVISEGSAKKYDGGLNETTKSTVLTVIPLERE